MLILSLKECLCSWVDGIDLNSLVNYLQHVTHFDGKGKNRGGGRGGLATSWFI